MTTLHHCRLYITVCFYCLTIFLSDELEEERRPLTKEEEGVEVIQSWVEAGGHPAHPEEEAKELLVAVSSFSWSSISPIPLHLIIGTNFCCFNLVIHFDPVLFFFLPGAMVIATSQHLRKEAWRLEERAYELETDGWRQMREVVAGSEAEGLYGLLKGVASYPHCASSHPPMKKPHLSPSSTITQSPLLEPTGPQVLDPAGQATVSSPAAATSAPEEDIPAHMQPLRVQVGVQSMCISAWLRVAKRARPPPGHH